MHIFYSTLIVSDLVERRMFTLKVVIRMTRYESWFIKLYFRPVFVTQGISHVVCGYYREWGVSVRLLGLCVGISSNKYGSTRLLVVKISLVQSMVVVRCHSGW